MLTPIFYTNDKNEKCVSFEHDGVKLDIENKIHLDTDPETNNTHEYYCVPNVFSKNNAENIIRRPYKFTGLPKDMIETIRAGYGDVIKRSLFRTEYVCCYLDREYGEPLRQKTMEGWKDAEFGWGFQLSGVNFGGDILISKDELSDFYPEWKDDYSTASFETEELAISVRKTVLDKVSELIQTYDRADSKCYETSTAAWKTYTCKYQDSLVDQIFQRWVDSTFNNEEYGDIYNNGGCIRICQLVLD